MGPYCVVHENFQSSETICGYTEAPRIPFGIVSLELTSYALSLGKFDSPDRHNPEVVKGEKIAIGSCISCHNNGSAGGKMAQRPWQVLAANSIYNGNYFRQSAVNPQKFKRTWRCRLIPLSMQQLLMRCRHILRPCYRGTKLLVILVVLEL